MLLRYEINHCFTIITLTVEIIGMQKNMLQKEQSMSYSLKKEQGDIL